MKRTLIACSVILGSLSGLAMVKDGQKTPGAAISSIAKSDLTQIKRIIQTQSAGAIDIKYNFYHPWINSGYIKAMKLAKKVKNYNGYKYALKYYVNGFHDEHMAIKFNPPSSHAAHSLYPGFFIRYLNNKFIVTASIRQDKSNRKLPPEGSQLVKCNGIKVRKLMLKNIFPFTGNPKLEADWVGFTPTLLVYNSNPFVDRITTCTFIFKRKQKTISINWRPLPKSFDILSVAWPYKPHFSIRSFAKNQGVWANIPTFSPRTPAIVKHLKKLVQESSKWRRKKFIVLDVRGNGGGNSEWGEQILKKIYGMTYFNWAQKEYPDHSYKSWRVSKGNYKHLVGDVLPHLAKSFGKSSPVYQTFKRTAETMKLKIDKNVSGYVRQASMPPMNDVELSNKALASLNHAKVVVITDGRCGSSCLTFVGEAIKMPNLLLMGKQTHADTIYTELRQKNLNSNYATFGFPAAVTYLRARKNNQPHNPAVSYKGDINNSAELQKWIVNYIQ